MKKLFLLLAVLGLPIFAGVSAEAQYVRYDAQFPSVSSSTTTPFLVANVPPNSPVVAVCNSPANQVPCTNYATTYTSLGVACPNGAQDTPQPQPSACQSTGDAQGNIGFWVAPGTYDYTVCIGISCFGPYTVTVGGFASTGIVWPAIGPAAPSPAESGECPTIGGTVSGPYWWVWNANTAKYSPAAVLESYNNTLGPISGTAIEFCNRLIVSDTGASPPTYKNSLMVVNHQLGNQTYAMNQDRALSVNAFTPLGDTATRHAGEAIQAEFDINGNPVLSNAGTGPDSEFAAFSGQLSDNHTALNATPGSYGVGGARMHYYREDGAGTYSSCAAFPCMHGIWAIAQNDSSVAGGGNAIAAVIGQMLDETASNPALIGYGGYFATSTVSTFGAAIYSSDEGSQSDMWDFYANSAAPTTNGRSWLGGVTFLPGITSNSNGAFPINASPSITGSIGTNQLPSAQEPSVTPVGTAGSTSYSYAVSYLDGLGNSTACSAIRTTTTGNATLNSSNFNELELVSGWPVGSLVSINVYRTASSGTPSSTGLIGSWTPLIDTVHGTGQNIIFKDTGLAGDSSSCPTANLTGGSGTYSYTVEGKCANGATPAVCGGASAGFVAVPTGTNPTLTIDTTAVTATSIVALTIDESATISGITCNTTLATLVQPVVTARSAGVSFTIQIPATLATNPACVGYVIH